MPATAWLTSWSDCITREAAAMLAKPHAALFSGFPLQPRANRVPRAARGMAGFIVRPGFIVR
jgi:hypothetical protein